jgi:hypothetical protein
MSEQPPEQPVNQWLLTITVDAEVVKGNQSGEEEDVN